MRFHCHANEYATATWMPGAALLRLGLGRAEARRIAVGG